VAACEEGAILYRIVFTSRSRPFLGRYARFFLISSARVTTCGILCKLFKLDFEANFSSSQILYNDVISSIILDAIIIIYRIIRYRIYS